MTRITNRPLGPVYRDGAPADAAAVANLVGRASREQRHLNEWMIAQGHVVVAVWNDDIVGVGASATNSVHPARVTRAVLVAEEHRRSGIGSGLLARVRDLDNLPSRVRVPAEDAATVAFFRRHGLATLVASRLIVVDPRRHSVARWAENVSPIAGLELTPVVVPLADEVVSSVVALYERTHRWDPPAPLSLADARRYLTDDVCFGVTAMHGGDVRGVALAHHADVHEVAFAGGVAEGDALLSQVLVAWLCAHAEGALEFEVDEGEGASDDLMGALRAVPEATIKSSVLILGER